MDTGCSVFPDILTDIECDELIAATAIAERSRAGSRHLMSNPFVVKLANDSRLLAIAAGVLGHAIPFRATLLEKSGERNWLIAWHQDTALPLQARFESGE